VKPAPNEVPETASGEPATPTLPSHAEPAEAGTERREIELELAILRALRPVRDKPGREGFSKARLACDRLVEPLSSSVALELKEALGAAERLLEFATRGLALDLRQAFTPRDGKERSGAYTLEEGVAKGSGDPFWFPGPTGCTTTTLCELAQRDKGSQGTEVRHYLGGAWALVVLAEIQDANDRLSTARAGRFTNLSACLARHERRRYASLLATAEAALDAQDRRSASWFYRCLARSEVSCFLDESEKERVAAGVAATR
jgi:hypothetical protein